MKMQISAHISSWLHNMAVLIVLLKNKKKLNQLSSGPSVLILNYPEVIIC